MTEPERTEREQRYRGPLPGEVPLSRDSRAGGATPGLSFDPVTGRVVREAAVPEEERAPTPPSAAAAPEPPSSGPSPSASGPAPHVADRAPSREQRRTDGRAMIPLLAQALSTQLARIAADDGAAPDGWWFTPER